MDLKLWLKERELNARQIASRKTIADRSVWIEDANYFNAAYDAIQRAELQGQKPIDMVLHCPACGLQHVDAPDERTPGWVNEPHRSHLCHDCGHIWRPADVPTNGVAAVKTKGKADSPVDQAPNAQQAEHVPEVHFGKTMKPETLRVELQKMCSAWGAYWRGSDAHGVELTTEQAVELLQNALNVEVEIKNEEVAQQAEAQEPRSAA